ncbi:MAG: hypothetical protein R3D00_00465 [Bacteroidia bacterium]
MQKYPSLIPAFFFLFLGLQINLPAQSDPRVDKKMEGMHQIFDLTDAQSDEIRSVLTATASQLDKIRPLRQTDRNAFRRQRQQIMQNMESGVTAALDETQAEQFRQMLAEYRARKRSGGNGSDPEESANEDVSAGKESPSGKISSGNISEISSMTQENEEIVEENTENAGQASVKNEWLEKTLDFLYEDILMPAVRKRQ